MAAAPRKVRRDKGISNLRYTGLRENGGRRFSFTAETRSGGAGAETRQFTALWHIGRRGIMFSMEIECDPSDKDLLIAELWERGVAGVVELSPARVRAFFEDEADRQALLRDYPGSPVRQEEQRDWVQAARDLLQPMEVGNRFFLVPEWRIDAAPEGRFRIAVNPGMAFGTGVHETTRLCMEALEDYLKPGMRV